MLPELVLPQMLVDKVSSFALTYSNDIIREPITQVVPSFPLDISLAATCSIPDFNLPLYYAGFGGKSSSSSP